MIEPENPTGHHTISAWLEGYCHTQIVCTAVQLGVLENLAVAPKCIEEIAEMTECDTDALQRLIYALESLGLVERSDQDRRFVITTMGRLLLPGEQSHESALLIADLYYTTWAKLSESVRTGQPAFPMINGLNFWDHLQAGTRRAQGGHKRAVCCRFVAGLSGTKTVSL